MHDARKKDGERGAVLLGVLVTVAAMATLAAATVDDIASAVRRSNDALESQQAFWYAAGVERMAAIVLRRSRLANDGHDTAADAFLRGPMRFPIDGGFIEARITDGGNCFNLNSLVAGEEGGTLTADPVAGERFVRLLRLLGVAEGDARAIAAAAADWIDSDNRPEPRGAEDSAYAGRAVPMRTAGTLMADASEFRALAGVDVETYRRVRPLLCALPSTAAARLNINTLTVEQSALLRMLADDGLSESAARAAIEDRPRDGYRSVAQFLDGRSLRDRISGNDERAQLDTITRYYRLEAVVALESGRLELRALFEAQGKEIRQLWRSLGSGA